MRFGVESDFSKLEDEAPMVVFTAQFFKRYRQDGLIEFAEWCYRNDIDVCIQSGEVKGYDLIKFDENIILITPKIKAVVCFNLEIHSVRKGFQFTSWENLMSQDIKSGYLVSNVNYGDKTK